MKRPQSYSSISLYKQCPHRYHWAYVLGNKEPPNKYAERGTELHALLEEFFKGGRYPSANKTLAPWQRFMENLTTYNPTPEGEMAINEDLKPCGFEDPSAYARGKGDLKYRLLKRRHILDWKSGKVYDSHEGQGIMYMVLDDPYAEDPEDPVTEYTTEFVYLDQPTHTIRRHYSASDRVIETVKLVNIIEIINHDELYLPKPSEKNCEWCPRSWRRGGDCRSAP